MQSVGFTVKSQAVKLQETSRWPSVCVLRSVCHTNFPRIERRYHAMFQSLKDAGIHVVSTLHHFVHPRWFQDLGGFLEEKNLPLFTSFCAQMAEEFSQYVDMWVTFNEPAVVCLTGHVFGIFPPGVHSSRYIPSACNKGRRETLWEQNRRLLLF